MKQAAWLTMTLTFGTALGVVSAAFAQPPIKGDTAYFPTTTQTSWSRLNHPGGQAEVGPRIRDRLNAPVRRRPRPGRDAGQNPPAGGRKNLPNETLRGHSDLRGEMHLHGGNNQEVAEKASAGRGGPRCPSGHTVRPRHFMHTRSCSRRVTSNLPDRWRINSTS